MNEITANFTLEEQEPIVATFKAYDEAPSTGGTTNYNLLENKPKINGVELVDDVALEQLGVQPSGNYATEEQLINGLATKQDIGIYLTEETDPIYTADKPNIALKSELPNLSTYATKTDLNSKQNKLTATGTRTLPVYYDGSQLKEVGGLRAEMVAGGFTREIYYAHHPEMSDMHIFPFIYNDFAFIDKKGGSYTVIRNDNGEIGNPHNIFDATPSFMHSRDFTSDTVWTVEIICPVPFTYGTLLYVDFGSQGFFCTDIKIEAQHSATGVWKTVMDKTNNDLSYVYCRCSSDDIGVNKFKFTFKNPLSTHQFRISSIGAISYKSNGIEETVLTLKGGEVFGDVIAPNITKLQNDINDIKISISNLEKALSELK
jgi:hypothetical protein